MTSLVYAEKIAIKTKLVELTYRDFAEYCSRMGAVFHGLGLKPGDRIAFLDVNSLELAAAHFAVPSCGMVVLPINHRLSKQEIVGVLVYAEASALVYATCFGGLVDDIRGDIGFVKRIICTESREAELDLSALMKSPPLVDFDDHMPDDHATLLYSSGTTGRPKGVKLSHANKASILATLLIELALTPADIGLMVAPLFHVAGCQIYMGLIARGCTVHLLPAFEPRETLDAIAVHKATVSLLVPAMIGAMLKHPEQVSSDTSSLRLVVYAGAPMPEALLKSAIQRFGNVFFQIYGLTETSLLTCLRVEDHAHSELLSSAGRKIFQGNLPE